MLILFSCKYLSVGLSFTVFILLGLLFWRINVLIKIRLRFECETIFRQHKGVALATDIMSRRRRCIFWCKTELRFKNFGRTIKTVVSRCCDNPQSTRYAVTNALNVHIGRRLQSVVACLRLVARTVFDRLRCQTTHTRKHTHTHTLVTSTFTFSVKETNCRCNRPAMDQRAVLVAGGVESTHSIHIYVQLAAGNNRRSTDVPLLPPLKYSHFHMGSSCQISNPPTSTKVS